MRAAVVNWTDRRVGGAETYLGLVIPALRQSGHTLFYWHEQNEPADRDTVAGIADVPSSCASDIGLEAAVNALGDWKPDVLFIQGLVNPEVERALLTVAPAVFFGHGYYGTCISGAKTTCVPVVQPCSRTFGPACLLLYYPRRCGGLNPLTMATDYRRQSARLANLRRYRAIVTFSEHMRGEYLKHGFRENQVHRLPPIDVAPAEYNVAGLTTEHQPTMDAASVTPTWRLTFIGRMDRLKGVRVLLDALPAVRRLVKGRIEVTIAGDGPDMERCREAARTASTLPDTEVAFLGWVSRERCAELLEASDVLVLPSLWPEPFGLVGLEALRRGVPVAAFAVGGIPEWLEDGKTGALAPADPPTATGLAAAVFRCLTSPVIRQTVSDRARQHLWAGSTERHVEALVPLLASAASRTIPDREPKVGVS